MLKFIPKHHITSRHFLVPPGTDEYHVFHRTRDIPVHSPIIRCLNPGAADEIDRGVGQFVHLDIRFGILKYKLVVVCDLFENALVPAPKVHLLI